MSDAASAGATRTPDMLLGAQPLRTAVLEPPGLPSDPSMPADAAAGYPYPSEPQAPPRIAIRMDEVTKVYPNGKHAVEDIDLVVPEGDFVFLVGPSGAGKSTLIKLLVCDEEATSRHARGGWPRSGHHQAGRDPTPPAPDRHRVPGLPACCPARRSARTWPSRSK